MQSAPLPLNEPQRLRAIEAYRILDTLPEADFDDLTRLAALICQRPIALISLNDEEHQWFKSKHGITASETPRGIAFCAHAILNKEIFEISDASKDARFAENPLVTKDPKIRLYAGTPLQTPEGHNIGTLCVIGRQPRKLTSGTTKSAPSPWTPCDHPACTAPNPGPKQKKGTTFLGLLRGRSQRHGQGQRARYHCPNHLLG